MSVNAGQKVIGRCPTCLNETLFLAAGGHVTCSFAKCEQPDAASLLLQNVRERAAAIMEELAPEPPKSGSTVSHPAHYGGAMNPYETIKVIEAWELDFNLGNAVKYISRAGKKPDADEVEDLEKGRWYLTRAIQLREGP
jgi:hypothetical protein